MDILELIKIKDPGKIKRHPWEIARTAIAIKILKKHLLFPVESLIDIGSGDCFVIQEMLKKKIANKYVAIDTAYQNAAVKDYLNNVVSNSIELNHKINLDIHYSDTSVLILIMDVLEHLKNEGIILSALGSLKKANDKRIVLITVPAFQSLFSSHDISLGHYKRYNSEKLKNLCLNYGLEPIAQGYLFTILLIPRWIAKTLEKYLNKKLHNTVYEWNQSKFITMIFVKILMLDFYINKLLAKFGIKLPGLSCYCLCKI
jgi:hypothetical protein